MTTGRSGEPWSRRRFIVTAGGVLTGAALLGAGAAEVLLGPSPPGPLAAGGGSATPAAGGSPSDGSAGGSSPPSATASPEATQPAPSSSPASVPFRTTGAQGVALSLARRPYSSQPVLPEHPTYAVDRQGVPIITHKGVVVTHPQHLAAVGLALLDSYAQTGARTYLDQARAIATRLASIGIASRGGIYLPYSFDFALHGRADDIIRTPWPSAMAQGQALSMFVRLHMATGDDSYRGFAGQLFTTLADPGVRATPWVSRVDARHYLWLEEYPAPIPDQTLNGFLFAIFGLYDYDQAAHDPDSVAFFDGAVTTIKHYLPAFRHAHAVSYYCLAHHVVSAHYHDVVITQLHQMARLTGDVAFSTAADQFKADHV